MLCLASVEIPAGIPLSVYEPSPWNDVAVTIPVTPSIPLVGCLNTLVESVMIPTELTLVASFVRDRTSRIEICSCRDVLNGNTWSSLKSSSSTTCRVPENVVATQCVSRCEEVMCRSANWLPLLVILPVV